MVRRGNWLVINSYQQWTACFCRVPSFALFCHLFSSMELSLQLCVCQLGNSSAITKNKSVSSVVPIFKIPSTFARGIPSEMCQEQNIFKQLFPSKCGQNPKWLIESLCDLKGGQEMTYNTLNASHAIQGWEANLGSLVNLLKFILESLKKNSQVWR